MFATSFFYVYISRKFIEVCIFFDYQSDTGKGLNALFHNSLALLPCSISAHPIKIGEVFYLDIMSHLWTVK